eukprot:CAMPEP_0198242968 /NCGR_PEP_ID=MMETSP1446-20131203/23033_1 /TAXON_ID=1461542 ORGANISM="Unidentified sp, Strain CCMP2111" /NCGR_SAMPLE_ID=MMETSP1446 /ASSEMBLY_ACC=CAM_ASM_001112 /LENGTH=348 /DNA_ID=CAMNT_0043926647 /DNA_START=234 /DNA_END=1280 /DNA_ORIENTATION=+
MTSRGDGALSQTGLKPRVLIPTSGTRSVSLWDAPDVATLKAWLDENLSEYCTNECFEVVEDFCQGIAVELARVRVSETMGEKASTALSATTSAASNKLGKGIEGVGKGLEGIDQKLKIKEKAKATGTAVKQTGTVVKERTKHALDKVGKAATDARERAMSNEVVATGVQKLGSGVSVGIKAAGSGLSYVTRALGHIGDTVMKSVQELDQEVVDLNEELRRHGLDLETEPDEPADDGEAKAEQEYFTGFGEDPQPQEEAGDASEEIATQVEKLSVQEAVVHHVESGLQEQAKAVEEVQEPEPEPEPQAEPEPEPEPQAEEPKEEAGSNDAGGSDEAAAVAAEGEAQKES